MRRFRRLLIILIRPTGPIENKVRYLQTLVDSAPGHQETLKPPSGGFFICGLAGVDAISLGHPYLELSFKRTYLRVN